MDLFEATKFLRTHRAFAYAAAVFGPLAAFALRALLADPLIGLPYLTFFPAVIIAAFLGGWIPGLIAAAFSGALAAAYFMDPLAPGEAPSKILSLTFYGLVSVTMILLVSELRRFNDALERRVALRTHELAEANSRLKAEIVSREASEDRVRQTQKIEALGQLTGGIAHDFNNMLAVVMGNLDVAARRVARGEDALRFIRNAREGAEKSAVLTRRLLVFSRRQPLSPRLVEPDALIDGMADLLRLSVGADVELDVAHREKSWTVLIDPVELENAVVNLAVNARDAMPDGGRLTIETYNVAAAGDQPGFGDVAPGPYAAIAVTDTGEGMSEDVLARAFDPFYTTKGVGEGSGLGLSQVYGFVKQSGGHVRILSRPGEGTRVTIYLPREEAGPTLADGSGPEDESAPEGRGETILVVEDDDDVRRATVALLRELGYGVRAAANGHEALAELEKDPEIALLFTDVVMPGMSGRELAERVARLRPGLRALYTTGFTRGALADETGFEGPIDVLRKPFAADELARKIRRALDRGA